MGLAQVIFNKQQGGLGRVASGEDHKSGLLAYCDTLPSEWGAVRYRQLFGIAEAESYGLVGDWSDETVATGGNALVTTAGSAGNINTVTMDGVVLGSYTVVTGDDVNDVASGLRLAINNLTSSHGYSAAGSAANVALTAPAGKGASINGGSHLVWSSTGTGAATITQFSSGVSSILKPIHYHVSEYFRINPSGELWVMLCEVPGTWADFSEIQMLKTASSGAIRQYMFYAATECDLEAAKVVAAQTEMTALELAHAPASIILVLDMASVTDLTTLPNLRSQTAQKVSVVIGQAGTGSIGAGVAAVIGKSCTCAGAVLGAISLAKVHENIGWIEKFNIAGTELTIPALANGELISTISDGAITSLHEKGYIFIKNEIGITGTYLNDACTAVALTSDYAYIENNRTIDKAIRLCRAALLPKLKGPVYLDPTAGTLDAGSIRYYQELCNTQLELMIAAGELSGGQTLIDSTQDILSTSTITITIELVPVGVSRTISVSIGFTINLS